LKELGGGRGSVVTSAWGRKAPRGVLEKQLIFIGATCPPGSLTLRRRFRHKKEKTYLKYAFRTRTPSSGQGLNNATFAGDWISCNRGRCGARGSYKESKNRKPPPGFKVKPHRPNFTVERMRDFRQLGGSKFSCTGRTGETLQLPYLRELDYDRKLSVKGSWKGADGSPEKIFCIVAGILLS